MGSKYIHPDENWRMKMKLYFLCVICLSIIMVLAACGFYCVSKATMLSVERKETISKSENQLYWSRQANELSLVLETILVPEPKKEFKPLNKIRRNRRTKKERNKRRIVTSSKRKNRRSK